ncbi:enoyl-CoA hydratase/isomerase family protein [Pseudonocardia spinosispora]|uniref:enoyl-CoA hydratase/isomerase family protein n=1 Tax=Pseudonocardia spinosispora TaxID=103441 RepID=UPI00040A431F|nr:enoyl-CoA hydratase/isomerase family protein [Pseudonocardia spinosispora]
MADEVLVHADGRVGRLTLNRPSVFNAINVGLARGLEAGVRELAAGSDVIVIRGTGGNLSVGGDVHEVDRLRKQGREALAELFRSFRAALAAIAEVPVPVVVVVEGNAAAGGFELIQACDIAVASTDARLADIHARFGQIPGGGSTQRLAEIVGRQRALGLILTGDRISGADAAAWGLVYRAVPPDHLEQAVGDLTDRLLAGSAPALAASKRLVRASAELSLDEGLDLELEAVLDHLVGSTGDAAIAAFTERK